MTKWVWSLNNLYIPSLSPYAKGYHIYFEKEEKGALQGLPKKEWPRLEQLYEKIQQNPKRSLKELLELHRQFPQVFEIVNLLTFAYLKLKKKRAAEKLIAQAYFDFPDSLIAKINYADQLLRMKKWQKIPEIFHHHTDLNTLYPKKEKYHYTEFRGFMVLMGFYHLKLGEKDKAESYYQLAFQVDPLHPSVSLLERAIKKSRSLLARIFKIT